MSFSSVLSLSRPGPSGLCLYPYAYAYEMYTHGLLTKLSAWAVCDGGGRGRSLVDQPPPPPRPVRCPSNPPPFPSLCCVYPHPPSSPSPRNPLPPLQPPPPTAPDIVQPPPSAQTHRLQPKPTSVSRMLWMRLRAERTCASVPRSSKIRGSPG